MFLPEMAKEGKTAFSHEFGAIFAQMSQITSAYFANFWIQKWGDLKLQKINICARFGPVTGFNMTDKNVVRTCIFTSMTQ